MRTVVGPAIRRWLVCYSEEARVSFSELFLPYIVVGDFCNFGIRWDSEQIYAPELIESRVFVVI